MKENLATLISGGGTTMAKIIKACYSNKIPMNIACVISSSRNAGGIEKARQLGIPEKNIVIIDPNNFLGDDGKVDQERFGIKIVKELREHRATIVTQNGWMPLTPEKVIEEYPKTIFNQHPGPTPEFGGKGMFGKRVHAARLFFVRSTGRDFWTETVAQRVAKKFDMGTIVHSARVNILPEDTVESLQQRVLQEEHKVQIGLLQKVARGDIREIKRNKILVKPGEERILVEAKRRAKILYPNG
jgi:phosphoribosylglycinamide formyltransferase-1